MEWSKMEEDFTPLARRAQLAAGMRECVTVVRLSVSRCVEML